MELLIIAGIQISFYIITFIFRDKLRIKNITLAFLQVLIFYIALLVAVKLADVRIERELYSFDLNNDGVFSGAEICPEQEEAMLRYISDVGRNFAPFTGAVVSLFYLPFAFIIEKIIEVARKNR